MKTETTQTGTGVIWCTLGVIDLFDELYAGEPKIMKMLLLAVNFIFNFVDFLMFLLN